MMIPRKGRQEVRSRSTLPSLWGGKGGMSYLGKCSDSSSSFNINLAVSFPRELGVVLGCHKKECCKEDYAGRKTAAFFKGSKP